MSEKDEIFSSETKYGGIFDFRDFYAFCHEFLSEEIGVDVSESKYEEKIKGTEKEIVVKWDCDRKLTDYFKLIMKVEFSVRALKNVEINSGGKKIKTNDGSIKIKVKGILEKDYQGKFESNAFNKFIRGIYEKWIIPSRIEEYENKVYGSCDKFISNAKSYLDLEGKK